MEQCYRSKISMQILNLTQKMLNTNKKYFLLYVMLMSKISNVKFIKFEFQIKFVRLSAT
ncbi:hypothetical protein NBO_451g0006 [Nosema bombycis CQ1]|uniref:Uncharacterized protein n=1 Tax=Nosema bombycis (strain CQ1 / CVCC 102059) TaxID=578461 RepID=R0MEA0_NOSB1|nr:hypothetical protein NBO_451g0006 [Nosema bombycis CQ1]|eukprot:EOB12395.1 hypothetical protein NBO_451g0006 [Nosema bombycis CQ1]